MFPKSFSRGFLLFAGVLLLFSGCISAPLNDARTAFYNDNPEGAEEILAVAENSFTGRDKLLFLMERGLILHELGKYKESANTLLRASSLIEEQDILNIASQTVSIATNDWVTEYKGEYSERLWVHTYLMMNFLVMSRYESALVEAKQAMQVLERYPEALKNDHFTRALIALCFERLGELNGAYIEYKKLARNLPDPWIIRGELYRLATALGFSDEAGEYKRRGALGNAGFRNGNLIIFAALGSGPIKKSGDIVLPPSIRFSFPVYEERYHHDLDITVSHSSKGTLEYTLETDINEVAGASLRARAEVMAAKETARAALKEALAREIERKNDEIVGILFRAALFVMEEADTRAWETLPGALQVMKFSIPPGRHSFLLEVRGRGGGATEIEVPEFNIRSGETVYKSIRIRN